MVKVAVILGGYPGEERDRRANCITSYSTADVSVEVVPVAPSPYATDLTEGELGLITPDFVMAALAAERDGYDAVVPFGTLDIGVQAARTYLKIPIVGPLEAGLRLASFVGDTYGLVTYTEHATAYQSALARLYGCEDRIVRSQNIGISIYHLKDDPDEVRRRFVAAGQQLVKEGAQVIIPAGVSCCPVWMTADSLAEEIGVPVVECVGAPVRIATILAQQNLAASRQRYPEANSIPEIVQPAEMVS
jgi:allantoin racemase